MGVTVISTDTSDLAEETRFFPPDFDAEPNFVVVLGSELGSTLAHLQSMVFDFLPNNALSFGKQSYPLLIYRGSL